MSDPYIIKDAQPRKSKTKLIALIGGSTLAGALLIGGTAFGLHQLQEANPTGVVADEETEFGVPGDEDGDDEGFGEHEGEDEGFGEDEHESGEHAGRESHDED